VSTTPCSRGRRRNRGFALFKVQFCLFCKMSTRTQALPTFGITTSPQTGENASDLTGGRCFFKLFSANLVSPILVIFHARDEHRYIPPMKLAMMGGGGGFDRAIHMHSLYPCFCHGQPCPTLPLLSSFSLIAIQELFCASSSLPPSKLLPCLFVPIDWSIVN